MNSLFIRRIARGYVELLMSLARVIGTLLALLCISAAVSVPLWFLATRIPDLFNVIVIAAVAGAVAYYFVKKWKKRDTNHSRWWMILALLSVIGPAFLLKTVNAVIVGGIFLSIVLAWRASSTQ